MMRKQYLRILCALITVAGFGLAAQGQTVDQIYVKIPFEFVAAGKKLPAGNYRVNRVLESSGALILSSFENRAAVIVVPNQSESGPAEKVYLNFEKVGDRLFLTTIQTGDHLFTIPVPRKAIMEAQARTQSGASALGSMAGNN